MTTFPPPLIFLPLDFPPLLVVAEQLAQEVYSAMRDEGVRVNAAAAERDALPVHADMMPWDALPTLTRAWWIQAQARPLANLMRESSRDRWVRWGFAKDATEPLESYVQSPSRWYALRDNPAALRVALLLKACGPDGQERG